MNNNGLYVHIPFCGAICHYCDFVKFIYQKDWINPYLERLKADLAFFNVPVDLKTIYVGGGTPTSLSYVELATLLEILAPYTRNVHEYTFEANVESLDETKLKLLKKYGVNRLSLGVQTTDDKRLAFLNRQHTYLDVKAKIALLKRLGFTNFSVDLIYGLPGQDSEALITDLANILALDPPHISTYSLTIEPNTVAFIRHWPQLTSDESRSFYDLILHTLRANGYKRYEVSNFARPGFESVHNKLYWQNKNYYAIGLGASGYIGRTRYTIGGSLTKYLHNTNAISQEEINEIMFIEEYLMLNLRLSDGFSQQDFAKQTGVNFYENFGDKVTKLCESGLLSCENDIVRCTDNGLMLLDTVILQLLSNHY